MADSTAASTSSAHLSKRDSAPPHVSFMAGATAGSVAAIVTNPLDVIRTRLQASRETSQALGAKRLSTTIKVMHQEGFRKGYMRGLVPNLLAGMASRAVYLTLYTQNKTTLTALFPNMPNVVSGLSALTTSLGLAALINPIYVVRVRLQLEASTSLSKVTRHIWKTEGPRGFFRGMLTGVLGRTSESVLYFLVYEHIKRTRLQDGRSQGVMGLQFFMMSMWARLCAAMLAYPHNVIQTHLREVSTKTGQHEFSGIFATAGKIWHSEGLRGFYYGLIPHIARVVPNTGITFLVYELMVRWWGYKG